MARCGRCWLHKLVRIVNLFLIFIGICLIVYSLWLQKKWNEGVSQLPSASLPRPWFIYTSFGVGIAICLSTLFGYMMANCMSNSTICIYIITICSLLLLEIVVIVTILFKKDWTSQMERYIDKYHKSFEIFLKFHLSMCRLIFVMVLVPQMGVLGLSCVLWIVGAERIITANQNTEVLDFSQSFLVLSPSVLLLINQSRQSCRGCESLRAGQPRQNLFTYVQSMFQRITTAQAIIH